MPTLAQEVEQKILLPAKTALLSVKKVPQRAQRTILAETSRRDSRRGVCCGSAEERTAAFFMPPKKPLIALITK
jgi:hypothetical protein